MSKDLRNTLNISANSKGNRLLFQNITPQQGLKLQVHEISTERAWGSMKEDRMKGKVVYWECPSKREEQPAAAPGERGAELGRGGAELRCDGEKSESHPIGTRAGENLSELSWGR